MRAACRWRCWRPPLSLTLPPQAGGGDQRATGGGDQKVGGGDRTRRAADVWRASSNFRPRRGGKACAQAAAVCAGLRLLTVTAADREAAAAALADVGYAFAPRIERAGERIFFETEDLARLYPAGETAIAQAVQAAAARVGLGVRVAIAASKGVARLATRARELMLVPTTAGPARAALAAIPVEVLADDVIDSGTLRGSHT